MNDYSPAMPVHAEDAERWVIGAALTAKDACADILATGLLPEHFYFPKHGEVFSAISELFEREGAYGPVLIGDLLERRGTLARVGGLPYLHTLFASCPLAVNVEHHVEVVLDKFRLRGLQEATVAIQQMVATGQASGNVAEVIDDARARLDKVASLAIRSETREFADDLDDFLIGLDSEEDVSILPSGLVELDELLSGGFRPGQLVIVGARPGIGKSVLATNFAANAAQLGHGVLFCSLEMSRHEIVERLLADQANTPLDRIRRPVELDEEDRRHLAMGSDRLRNWPLQIVDDAKQTLGDITRAARDRAGTPRGLRLLVVDYLQLMSSTPGARVDRHLEVGEWSRGLKILGKQLGITVVALSQLNRGPTQTANSRPQLAHLRESGSLEQDADMVFLLHRDPEDLETQYMIQLIVAKQRGGRTDTLDLLWSGPHQRVSSNRPFATY